MNRARNLAIACLQSVALVPMSVLLLALWTLLEAPGEGVRCVREISQATGNRWKAALL